MTPLEEEDLKRPDRVPDRVPQVGDLVKIKSRAWYDKWAGPKLREVSGIAPPMAEFCGWIMSVESVRKNGYLGKFDTFRLNEDNGAWTWCITDFENVYPADSAAPIYGEYKTSTSDHPKDTPLKLVDINPIKLKKV